MSDSRVSEETRQQLAEMFLPELHQAWWSERLAQLRGEQHAATDLSQAQAMEQEIREHYKLRHDLELTRNRLVTAKATIGNMLR